LGADTITVWAPLNVPISVLPNVRVLGVADGAIGFAVPLKEIDFENPEMVSVAVSVAVLRPTCEGMKLILKKIVWVGTNVPPA
jgi:hypothetical protein